MKLTSNTGPSMEMGVLHFVQSTENASTSWNRSESRDCGSSNEMPTFCSMSISSDGSNTVFRVNFAGSKPG